MSYIANHTFHGVLVMVRIEKIEVVRKRKENGRQQRLVDTDPDLISL